MHMNIKSKAAVCCAAAVILMSSCGNAVTDNDTDILTSATAETEAETADISDGETDTALTAEAEEAVTFIAEELDSDTDSTSSSKADKKAKDEKTDSSADKESSSKDSKKKKKSDKDTEDSGEEAVTELGTSSEEEKSSKKKKKSDDSSKSDDDKEDEDEDDRADEIILNYQDRLEAYSKVKQKDFIERTNAELIEPDKLIDTSTLGKHEATVRIKYEGVRYNATVRYTVEDTRAPIVLNRGDGAYVPLYTDLDLGDYVGYADNFDRHPKLTYEGEVDTYEAGTYPITATITDESGNSFSWDLTLYVGIDPPDEYTYTGDGMSFDEFMTAYSGENRAFGLDVSQWQAHIDWQAVKEAGCEFAIIRIGYGDNDGFTMDERYLENIEGAADAGIQIGIYYYSEDSNAEAVRDHARQIAGILAGRELDFPVAFDWEDFLNFQNYGMSIDDLNELFEVFADELSLYGLDTMLYGSKDFIENFWYNDYHRPVWLAHYVEETDYAGEYIMWQRCYGLIDGIDGDADFNVLYKSGTEEE